MGIQALLQKMNILFVNELPFNPVIGGLERVTDVLTKELVNRGHSIYYLCAKLPESCLYMFDYSFPVKLFQLPKFGLFNDEENIIFYKKLLADLKIEVVVNQRGLGGAFNALLQVTNTKTISVIHSIPDYGLIPFQDIDKLLEHTAPPFASLKKLIKKVFPSLMSHYWINKVTSELEFKYSELAKHSNAIVTLSEGCADKLRHFINISQPSKIVTIPNPNTFSVVDISVYEKKKLVLYVGRLERDDKDPMRLVKVWEYLHGIFPDWQLRIIGDGTEKGRMQEYIKVRRIKNVSFEGHQSDVSQYYRDASFVCLTSNYEGWGMSLTEGMQYGCVPLTFNNYGAASVIIDDGINGCLIPPYDLKQYAIRLSDLMSDGKMRRKISMAAIEKVKKFSVKNVADQWEQLCRSLD